jgi:hypothetical protein
VREIKGVPKNSGKKKEFKSEMRAESQACRKLIA